jgi:hypothetical protein
MKPNLNYWQTTLLYLPSLAAFVLMQTHHAANGKLVSLHTENVLFNLNIWLIITYQAWLCVKFNSRTAGKATWFSINALIPVAFFSAYFLYVLYLTYLRPVNVNLSIEPTRPAYQYFSGWIFVLFLLHAAINFFAINTPYVSAKIKKNKNADEREQLTTDFLNPLRRLIRASIILVISLIVITFIADIFLLL